MCGMNDIAVEVQIHVLLVHGGRAPAGSKSNTNINKLGLTNRASKFFTEKWNAQLRAEQSRAKSFN